MRKFLCAAVVLALAAGSLCHAHESDGEPTIAVESTRSTTQTVTTSKATASSSARTTTPPLGSGTCPSRTVNYITHTLPQQCLRPDRLNTTTTQSTETSIDAINLSSLGSERSLGDESATASSATGTAHELPSTEQSLEASPSRVVDDVPEARQTPSVASDLQTASTSIQAVDTVNSEAETDSPLDNAKFLSFEEWKQQNHVKAPEPGRDPQQGPDRPRPGINNALDGFGEEGEIELDFSGFGSPASGPRQQQAAYRASDDSAAGQATPTAHSPRSKDAGKTCKERTNYASFDCAATVLKNNPECKSASSVLVENKDSYMLNTCSAQNKFFIVELCNDILVDTIVLANYEFFSSIFRHFRVSVSDVYPVQLDKWKDLGTFEARNTREVQAFLIEHPQIWARYLRIEFLTHYGSEYYCPVSLLRIHGTTMLEDMRHQEYAAQHEVREEKMPAAEPTAEAQEPASSTNEHAKQTLQAVPAVEKETLPADGAASSTAVTGISTSSHRSKPSEIASQQPGSTQSGTSENSPTSTAEASSMSVASSSGPPSEGTGTMSETGSASTKSAAHALTSKSDDVVQTSENTQASTMPPGAKAQQSSSANDLPVNNSTPELQATDSAVLVETQPVGEPSRSAASSDITNSSDTALSSSSSSNSTKSIAASTASAPAPPQPSTQESFFKSIHKRLQQLEANSTLSLQYIEEQSRILRDAFSKVEKRQISATSSFLSNLNQTVMQELHGFRQAYDQLWQSTVIELEGQREQYQREMLAMSSRLTLVADELVWQKRMGIVQSTLLLLCLGLVLFARQGNTGYLEVPLMQQMMNKSSAALGRTGWESPPISPSPESRSPVSQFRRRIWRSVTDPSSGGGNATDRTASVTDSRPESKDGPLTVDVHVEPPTPPKEERGSASTEWDDADDEQDVLDPRESRSGPSTPRGTRESESAGEGYLDAG
ncbi:uncharacterized protein LTR77_008470 [Saxophila tyrrhenica]|uniref:SUN domain-containing protein n=1 Tax=Saxophila tyrrhenica TaxID=1690608 RepID=A0AAV9P102_9PEZI|nr:hypothetical protein LTR77_008470 [Saxophila tyrrhenica]